MSGSTIRKRRVKRVQVITSKLNPHRIPRIPFQLLSQKVLPLLLAGLLVMTFAGVGLIIPSPALAQADQNELTASYMPADIDFYLSLKSELSGDQLTNFWRVANNWWQDAGVQSKWQEAIDEVKSESDTNIDIPQDVLPWLGPELAAGMRNIYTEEPDIIVFIGTKDKSASDSFFFDKLAPEIAEEGTTPPSAPTGSYAGIETLYNFLDTTTFWAFTNSYIILSSNQQLLEECLDLLSGSSSDSLANTSNFQAAQSNLPAERAGMLYDNIENIWIDILSIIPPEQQAIFNVMGSYYPPYFTASVQFTEDGITVTGYCPFPEGITPPTTAGDELKSASIVPGDAWLFDSEEDVNACWQEMKSYLSDNWADIGEATGMGEEWPASLNDALTQLQEQLGFNIDSDVFGWMNGEVSMVLLPLSFPTSEEVLIGEPVIPDVLVLFEVSDTSAVQGHLTTIISGINTQIPNPAEQLQTSSTSIEGVSATMITNEAIAASGNSPGYLFLDTTDGTHYLVIGSTTDALTEAVKASQGSIASLDEAEEYQGVLSLLPDTKSSLSYFNITGILNAVASQIPTYTGMNSEEEDFNLATSLIPLHCALGFSSTVTASGVAMTGALYLLPPPLFEQMIAEGMTGLVEIAEQVTDFSYLDADVGEVAVGVDVNINNAPADANIKGTIVKVPAKETMSGFELAATDAGLSIEDVAYVLRVDKTNLGADNIGTATITMKVGRAWADKYGTDNVRIFRIGDDGTKEVLPTEFTGYEGDQAIFVGTSEHGLSCFGLAATSSPGGINWVLIGSIIVIALIVIFVLWRRRQVQV